MSNPTNKISKNSLDNHARNFSRNEHVFHDAATLAANDRPIGYLFDAPHATSWMEKGITIEKAIGSSSATATVLLRAKELSSYYAGIAGVASVALTGLPLGSTPYNMAPLPVLNPAASPARRSRFYAIVGDQITEQAKLGATCFRNAIADENEPTSIWTDGDEVVFEWLTDTDHAVVTIEDCEHLQYAMKLEDRFVPGQEIEARVTTVPSDLKRYISAK